MEGMIESFCGGCRWERPEAAFRWVQSNDVKLAMPLLVGFAATCFSQSNIGMEKTNAAEGIANLTDPAKLANLRGSEPPIHGSRSASLGWPTR